jgi:hypothetical protein
MVDGVGKERHAIVTAVCEHESLAHGVYVWWMGGGACVRGAAVWRSLCAGGRMRWGAEAGGRGYVY